MQIVIDIDEKQFRDIQRISEVQLKRRTPTLEQVVANGTSLLPSAERKTGHWIDYSDDGFVECPFCHSATNCYGDIKDLHFCFSCGAELDEVEHE